MSKKSRCAHCGGGKGRFACPTLESRICSRCCSDHQGTEIDCPDDCARLRHLSGEVFQRALAKLIAAVGQDDGWAPGAISAYLQGDQEGAYEWEEALLFFHLMLGHRDDQDRRYIDHVLDGRLGPLPVERRAAYAALRDRAWCSLFEITAIEKNVGLHLRDLALGEEIFVRERSATEQLVPRELLFGWVVELDGHLELAGGILPVRRSHREALLEEIEEQLGRGRKERADLTDLTLAWRRIEITALDAQGLPQVQNTDGEELLFCTANYEVQEPKAAVQRLRTHPELEDDEGAFVWTSLRDRTHLGLIEIHRKRLTFETNSRERLDRAKALLEDLLGDSITHRLDDIEDPEPRMQEAMERAKFEGRPPRDEPELPPEVATEVASFVSAQWMETWADSPVPMLDDHTPREAVGRKKYRELVREMLIEQEIIFRKMPGGEETDLDTLRVELGLPTEN